MAGRALIAWGTLRAREGALLLSFSFPVFAFSVALDFGFAGTLPLTCGVALDLSILAGAACRTRFAAGALSAAGDAARLAARGRDSGAGALLAARGRLGGMVSEGEREDRSARWSRQGREETQAQELSIAAKRGPSRAWSARKVQRKTRDVSRDRIRHVKCT